MTAHRLYKIMRRDVAMARSRGVLYIEWLYGIGTGVVSVQTITVAELAVFAAVLCMGE